MRKQILLIFFITFTGLNCSTKVYPDDKLAISPEFLVIFNSSIQKDTVRFDNSSNVRHKTLVITKVDSFVLNRKGWFINGKPFKRITAYFREIGTDTTILERENKIDLIKDPESPSCGITIQFNNLYFSDTILPLLRHDTISLNTKRFTNYYSFETTLKSKKPDDVKSIYINDTQGVLGFKTLSGEVWVR